MLKKMMSRKNIIQLLPFFLISFGIAGALSVNLMPYSTYSDANTRYIENNGIIYIFESGSKMKTYTVSTNTLSTVSGVDVPANSKRVMFRTILGTPVYLVESASRLSAFTSTAALQYANKPNTNWKISLTDQRFGFYITYNPLVAAPFKYGHAIEISNLYMNNNFEAPLPTSYNYDLVRQVGGDSQNQVITFLYRIVSQINIKIKGPCSITQYRAVFSCSPDQDYLQASDGLVSTANDIYWVSGTSSPFVLLICFQDGKIAQFTGTTKDWEITVDSEYPCTIINKYDSTSVFVASSRPRVMILQGVGTTTPPSISHQSDDLVTGEVLFMRYSGSGSNLATISTSTMGIVLTQNNCETRNCITCSNVSICDQCLEGYFLRNNACRKCNSQCFTCDSDQRCLTCKRRTINEIL